MTSSVFLSYRHEDTKGLAQALRDRLLQGLPAEQIFMDISGLAPGEDFARTLEQRVRGCAAMVVLIDHRWAGPDPSRASRLQDPRDWVRFEVGLALRLGKRVLPVLVDGARLPALDELPADLHPLVQLQTFDLRSARLNADAWDLAGHVVPAAGGIWPPPERGAQVHGLLSALYSVYVGLVLMVLMVGAIFTAKTPGPVKLGIALLVAAVVLVLRLPLVEDLRRLPRAEALEYAAGAQLAAFGLLVYGEGKGDIVLMLIFGVFPAALLYLGSQVARQRSTLGG